MANFTHLYKLSIFYYIKNNIKQIILFTIIGLITFALNFILIFFTNEVLELNYKVAISISYFITVLFHFNLHRIYTFRGHDSSVIKHGFRYLIMLFINYCITLVTAIIVVDFSGIKPYYSILFSVPLTAFSSFIIMKYLVFKKVDSSTKCNTLE